MTQPTILIDGTNTFLRSYVAYPSMTINGDQAGGIVGFLKTLMILNETFLPKDIFIAWENGASNWRRKIYADYKSNRYYGKLNRYYESDIPETAENQSNQLNTLIRCLSTVPVRQFFVEGLEGDDIIAWLVMHQLPSNERKIIISTDKDLYQLTSENVDQWSLSKRVLITEQDVLSLFQVSPINFGILKALAGDKSDNIPGVKGIGLKTVPKLFPFLASSNRYDIEFIISYASANLNKSSYYRRIFESADDVRCQYKLVQLVDSPPSEYLDRLTAQVIKPKSLADTAKLIRILSESGLGTFDAIEFISSFSCIEL